ncbi:MAG TPA: glutamine-hydrolyzing carbamoyl-phosphate synthase small subunit [Gaiellaceae bacterium]|nr:glutamine-hydrolyzing carbamoyl-phosphate synthase small subunit [Gaiellaceae bacterium]
MQSIPTGLLVLEDGTTLPGVSIGAPGIAAGEACFTTAMAGYEEAVTDPSYVAQVLCFAYPLVGTYGVDERRLESERVQCEGIVMRDARPAFAGWLRERGVVALTGVDTRTLVRRIRAGGVVRCALGDAPPAELQARALAEPPIDGRPLDRRVGTLVPYSVGSGPRVVVVDLGTKYSIPRRLAAAGLEALVVPATWDADAILEAKPRSVLVSNGPGDPAVLADEIDTIRSLLGRVPVFGICLGHQLLGLALGHDTFKLPFGHRGANHPVRDTRTGRVLVTVQNHGFAVAAEDDAAYVSLNDGTCEGLEGDGFASVQFHPEAAPGPLDALPFFDRLADACRSAPTFARS